MRSFRNSPSRLRRGWDEWHTLAGNEGSTSVRLKAYDNDSPLPEPAAVAENENARPAQKAQQAPSGSGKNERRAASKLRLAKKLLDSGAESTGKRWLKEIVEKYPETKAASEAENLLDE